MAGREAEAEEDHEFENVSHVDSLRSLLARAQRAGLSVEKESGDVVIRRPGLPVLRVNSRRKDGTPELKKLVLMAERGVSG